MHLYPKNQAVPIPMTTAPNKTMNTMAIANQGKGNWLLDIWFIVAEVVEFNTWVTVEFGTCVDVEFDAETNWKRSQSAKLVLLAGPE